MEHAPAVSQIARNFYLLDITCGFDAMRGKQAAQPLFECASASHGRLPGDEKHDILDHEAQDCLDIACSGGAVPLSDEIPDGLFVRVHGNSSRSCIAM